ncbi:MAG: shikimate kinase [Candidatus Limnocylindrales bacterium]
MTITPRHIVLVGLMGSGKTTVGAALGTALGWPHRDSDAELQTVTGRSAREIAAVDGIDHLHALESKHLRKALADPTPSVISAAASVVDEPLGRAALLDPGIHVVWLRVDPAVAAARAGTGDHRPSPEPLASQAARRDPWFAEVADAEVADADIATVRAPVDATVADIVAAVIRGIRTR